MGAYFASLNQSGELAAVVNRYYGHSEDAEFAEAPDFMRHMQSRLPLYKKWFEEAADESSQDWRLLAAIGYQESKWNPRAASGSGALGLMQLTMQSATAVKVANPTDPRQSIFGGARYFRSIYEKIPAHVPEPGSYLVRACGVQHRLRPCRGRAGPRAKSGPRSGLLGRRASNSCRCSPRNNGTRRPQTASRAARSPCATSTACAATSTCSNGPARAARTAAATDPR